MGSRLAGAQALPALLQIDQGNLDFGRLALTGDANKYVLDIDAAVLPTPLVHARQIIGQVLEHAIVHSLAMALASTTFVPLLDFLEAVQGLGHQQCAPFMHGIALCFTENDFRNSNIE
ncbi:hypothetical protein D9M73_174450 [compost metagenome]